ncbi:MAG: hypothetical protein ACM4D3_24450 [Candidatus Sericytochromatia bacterium]
MAASMDTLVHPANVGGERGKESPIPVSAAIATRDPYWMSGDVLAPGE